MMNERQHNIWKNKKGVNDISILTGIIAVFLLTSLMIVYTNSAFGTEAAEFNTAAISDDIVQEAESVSSISAFSILFTVLKLAFFDFGDTLSLPLWLDLFYTLLTIVFVITLARNIWIGGGG